MARRLWRVPAIIMLCPMSSTLYRISYTENKLGTAFVRVVSKNKVLRNNVALRSTANANEI